MYCLVNYSYFDFYLIFKDIVSEYSIAFYKIQGGNK